MDLTFRMWWPSRRMIVAIACCALIILGACAGSRAADLDGTWELVEIDAQPLRGVTADGAPRFTIKGQSIEGFDGCNQFSGRLDQPGSVSGTRRGCPGDVPRLPLDMSDLRAHLSTGRIDKDRMVVPSRSGFATAVFRRAKT